MASREGAAAQLGICRRLSKDDECTEEAADASIDPALTCRLLRRLGTMAIGPNNL
jgi:hypothetical protein